MIEHFLVVLEQVLTLLILIVIGYIVFKNKLIPKDGIPAINNFVLYIVTPCVIIQAFYREYDVEMLKSLAFAALASICIHLVSIIITHFVVRDSDYKRERVLRFSAIFPNCGYMALPLQLAILGKDGVFYGVAYIAIFNIFSWTYGIALMGGKSQISAKKLIINPGIIGVFLGLFLFFSQISLPSIPENVLGHLAALNTPLPMIIIGFYLAGITSFSVLKDAKLLLVIILKLLVFPLLAVGVLYFVGFRGTILISLAISASAPTAANTVMYATRFGTDTTLSSSLVSLTSLFSIVTMPLIISIAMFLA